MTKKATGKPGLRGKKTLLLHNYDLFIERQARLSITAESSWDYSSDDASMKMELLILDDLTIFAIRARRLLELCGLTSSLNRVKISPLRFNAQAKECIYERMDRQALGFETLLNRIIHMANFEYFHSWSFLQTYLGVKLDLYESFVRFKEGENRMDGVMFLHDKRNGTAFYFLKDIIKASIEVADAIVETCSNADVAIELSFRV